MLVNLQKFRQIYERTSGLDSAADGGECGFVVYVASSDTHTVITVWETWGGRELEVGQKRSGNYFKVTEFVQSGNWVTLRSSKALMSESIEVRRC